MRTHHLFVSHSWRYADAYNRLVDLLRKRPYFSFAVYSVPRDDPIRGARTDAQLQEAIREQMARCGVVLVLAGVYAATSYSKWIEKEVRLARDGFINPKPIVAVKPWGSERTSEWVKKAADRVVGWNTESVVSAIRELS